MTLLSSGHCKAQHVYIYTSWTDNGSCQAAYAALYNTCFGFVCNITKSSTEQTDCCISGGIWIDKSGRAW